MDFNKYISGMKKMYVAYLCNIIISIGLLSCKLVNAPFYLSCYNNPKVSTKPIHKAFAVLWANHPEYRLDFETLLSIAHVNSKFIKDGDYLLSLGDDIDELTKRQVEEKYFVDQDLNPDGQITYYWHFKSHDQTRIYVVKSMGCSTGTSHHEKEVIGACSFCLMSVMYLPIDMNSRWKSYFDMTSNERKENNRLFMNDIIKNIE